MAFLEYKNVRIAGIAAGVPEHVIKNVGKQVQSNDYDAAAFVEQTGVAERHVTGTLTTSDLGYLAAERLIADLNWKKEEIEAIIFVQKFNVLTKGNRNIKSEFDGDNTEH